MISRPESDLEQVKRSSAFDALGHKQGVSEPLFLPFRADVQLRSHELNQALDLTYHLSCNPCKASRVPLQNSPFSAFIRDWTARCQSYADTRLLINHDCVHEQHCSRYGWGLSVAACTGAKGWT